MEQAEKSLTPASAPTPRQAFSLQQIARQIILPAGIATVIILIISLIARNYYTDPNTDISETARIRFVYLWVVGAYSIFVGLVIFRQLGHFARKVLIGVLLFEMVIGLVSIASAGELTFVGWFFNPSAERVLGAIFSSGQYLVVGAIAAINGYQSSHSWQRGYWWILAAIFTFMGMDEYYAIHEFYYWWRTAYISLGAGMVLVSLAVYWFGYQRNYIGAFLALLTGLAVMGVSGVWMDLFTNKNKLPLPLMDKEISLILCDKDVYKIECYNFSVIEEFLEMAGVSLVLAGFLTFNQTVLEKRERFWRYSRYAMTGVGVAWLLWVILTFWVIPDIKARTLAESLRVNFLDGDLAIVGYNIKDEEKLDKFMAPGDEIDLTVYLRAYGSLSQDYDLSAHLWQHPDIGSFAQDDTRLGEWEYPSSAWLPYLAVEHKLHLAIPENVIAPASYWLVVQVWDSTNGTFIATDTTQFEKLSDNQFVFRRIAVLPDNYDIPAPTIADRYDFRGDFSLLGYEFPETGTAGDSVTFKFWWDNRGDIHQTLVHYVHIFHQDSDRYEVFAHETFDGRFPPKDWPAGVQLMDTWDIELPSDLPPGEYNVFTGMYDDADSFRIPVVDFETREEIMDFSIPIGTLTISAESAEAGN